MLNIFCIVLVFTLGWCTENQNVGTKTVYVGEDVTLTCSYTSSNVGVLFWVRVVDGNFPEVLGATYTFDSRVDNKMPRITTKHEPGTFVLSIKGTILRDTALYYCEIHVDLKTTFLEKTFLYVKERESQITAIIQDPVSDPLHPGDSKTLQCSVYYNSEKKTCPGDPSVYWFRTGSDKFHPTIFYTHGHHSEECATRPETHSLKNCTYSLNKNINSSDAGTYYCAVAACGDIFLGNGTKVHVKDTMISSFHALMSNPVCLSIVVILAISLIVIAFLIYAIKDQTSSKQKNTSLRNIKKDDACVYSAVVFTTITDRDVMKNRKAAERQRIYAAVKAFGLD